jgi:hypothetical protein
MSFVGRISAWRRGFQIASAVVALVAAIILIAVFVHLYLEVRACAVVPNDCDDVLELSPIGPLFAVGLLIGGGVALFWRKTWPLAVVWALAVLLPVGVSLYLFIPSVRQSYGLPPESIGSMLFNVLLNPAELLPLACLALAVLGLLPRRAEVREESTPS